MNKIINLDGFSVLIEASEQRKHQAVIRASASRAGKVLGKSREIVTDLTFIGLFSLENDKNIREYSEIVADMAVVDAKQNLQTMKSGYVRY